MLWPTIPEDSSDEEKDLAVNILPLPVDQRYTVEDMQYMLDELQVCLAK